MTIRVNVFRRAGRKFYEAQWTDPITGRKRTRTTKKTTRSGAERFAALLENELVEGAGIEQGRITWHDFTERYLAEHADTLALRTREKIITVFNSFEARVSPSHLSIVTAAVVSQYASQLRKSRLSESTIKGYLAHLRAAFRWAKRQGLMTNPPNIDMPKRANKSKGRAPTAEEFERILAKIPTEVIPQRADDWQYLCLGIWWSGLRLSEAIGLSWDSDETIMVDFSHSRPMFRIRAEAEKGNKNRILPMAPEFANLLEDIPRKKRRGFVFKGLSNHPTDRFKRVNYFEISKNITGFGEAAGVVVGKKRSGEPKYASAQDFRRAFGFRWSMRVLPPVLMEMMRHESIQTTMQFYVGRNAEVSAEVMWRAFSDSSNAPANTFANTLENGGEIEHRPPGEKS